MNDFSEQIKKSEQFRKLHDGDQPLVLPNIWDPLGALMLQNMGYAAAATSSSAIALTHGYKDGEKLPFNFLLERLKLIVETVKIPISADIESAYAHDENSLAENIKMILETGVVGINYEDSDKNTGQLIPIEVQCKRIRLIRKTADEYDIPLFINARVDTYVHGGLLSHQQKLGETLKRGEAYYKAGADCIFPILITDAAHIENLCSNLLIPLNVMIFQGIPDLITLRELGVKRISLGGGFLKTAVQPMKELAEKLKDLDGLDDIFGNKISSDYLNGLMNGNL